MLDPDRTYIDATVELAPDVTLFPGSVLQGATVIGEGAEIGPNTRLVECTVAARAVVEETVGRHADIGAAAIVGPYAFLEPGSHVAPGTRTGPFYTATAEDATLFLFDHQQQPDGSMPRNSLENGKVAPDTGGLQLDETSYPILMDWQSGLAGDSTLYQQHVIPAAVVADRSSHALDRHLRSVLRLCIGLSALLRRDVPDRRLRDAPC